MDPSTWMSCPAAPLAGESDAITGGPPGAAGGAVDGVVPDGVVPDGVVLDVAVLAPWPLVVGGYVGWCPAGVPAWAAWAAWAAWDVVGVVAGGAAC